MRDVGVIAFAQETAEKDRERNEVEFIIPVVQEAVRQSGMGRHDIGFTISGSCDYLSGGPFTFVHAGRTPTVSPGSSTPSWPGSWSTARDAGKRPP